MEIKEMKLEQRLAMVQQELNAPKDKFNSFGNYSYRSAEGIMEALKPLLVKYEISLRFNDRVELIGDRYYIVARAIFSTFDGEQTYSAEAPAREEEIKKGMDSSQLSGSCLSYARKYCLSGLFLIDDCKDADTDEYSKATGVGSKPTPQLELEAYIREVDGCKTAAALNSWWKNNRPSIPADILKQVYAHCKSRAEMLKQQEG